MSMIDGAWARFFCCCCQTERDNSEKVKAKNRVLCRGCHEKTRPMRVGRPAKEKMWQSDHELVIDQSVPSYVMDAYREERAE